MGAYEEDIVKKIFPFDSITGSTTMRPGKVAELERKQQEAKSNFLKELLDISSKERIAAGAGIPMYKKGGEVPGMGEGDIVPAMLEPGEWVIPKKVVKKKGKKHFKKMTGDRKVSALPIARAQRGGEVQKKQVQGWLKDYGSSGESPGKVMPSTDPTLPKVKPVRERYVRTLPFAHGANEYDYEGYQKEFGAIPETGHLTDKYKRPPHMTFSEESIYSTPSERGGRWAKEEGKWHFYASPSNVIRHSPKELQGYFKTHEPESVLHLPTEQFEHYQEGGEVTALPFAYGQYGGEVIDPVQDPTAVPVYAASLKDKWLNNPTRPELRTRDWLQTPRLTSPVTLPKPYQEAVDTVLRSPAITNMVSPQSAELGATYTMGQIVRDPTTGQLVPSPVKTTPFTYAEAGRPEPTPDTGAMSTSPYDREMALRGISERAGTALPAREGRTEGFNRPDVWQGSMYYPGTGGTPEEQAYNKAWSDRAMIQRITKTEDIYNSKGHKIGTREIPDYEKQVEALFGKGEKAPTSEFTARYKNAMEKGWSLDDFVKSEEEAEIEKEEREVRLVHEKREPTAKYVTGVDSEGNMTIVDVTNPKIPPRVIPGVKKTLPKEEDTFEKARKKKKGYKWEGGKLVPQ